jgi:hypothetical protein
VPLVIAHTGNISGAADVPGNRCDSKFVRRIV